ncbi:tRNA dimethylallyltransferase [Dyadobacter sp. CECT 9275]|uniref:tRNA dimethylallyltransferase n=1 Tax=Dyadobacter helix TaxID=2822344 RepID=A0A916JBU9_9BACT|nr:tRNA (adenosine(37)-N6)-dimethylallyltransferase MiaA [Dyadobacter sp. CECT 9275]CAG4997435.1 tRNA dimethylallyltransferase [Dyadobacter sp. CECT 9275]
MKNNKDIPGQPLLVILGPTASGKTHLAVQLAARLKGEIISADSRQVYRGMDIGTGKDLDEYDLGNQKISFHLINIRDAGEKYNLNEFVNDFSIVYEKVTGNNKVPIVCGGTGLYIHALLQGYGFVKIPVDEHLRMQLDVLDTGELLIKWEESGKDLGFPADISTRKRLIRNIEIAQYLQRYPEEWIELNRQRQFKAVVFGLIPDVATRRVRISMRLETRLQNGLTEEIERLLSAGIKPEQLIYYGLEYKYVTQYMLGILAFDVMKEKLETEIHRFAKRQMTFFRKMERDGIKIHWLDDTMTENEKIIFVSKTYKAAGQ